MESEVINMDLHNKAPRVVAEVGCNHRGEIDVAKEMIMLASQFCKADAVKFQKRSNRELLTEAEYSSPHPNPINSYGDTYGAHREYLEFSLEQHRELKEYCDEWGIIYSTSVWDMTSAKEIASLDCEFIKVPSACNLKFDLLRFLRDEYSGQVQLSLGMTTKKEEQQIVELFEKNGRAKDSLVLYSCTSGYPVAFEDICLYEIIRLRETFGERVAEIGFSGHHLGISADVAAMALGATWIERHYTMDRTWKGTDHSASLEPDGMRRLVRDIRNVHQSLTYKETDILPVEKVQRDKLKRV